MNAEQEILVQRLKEVDLDTKRFLKVGDDKAAFESEFQKNLYGPEDLDSFPRWGICGKDFLVLLDFDKKEIYDIMKDRLPDTFEVTSPRHGLPHRYYLVWGKQDKEVQNGKFHIPGDIDEKGNKNPCGEIRAQNHYLVAPGTVIRYKDLKTDEWKTGKYEITNNKPIAKLEYDDFMKAVAPYLLDKIGERILTNEKLEKGVSTGERHDTIFRYACRLVGDNPEGRFPASVALDILRRYNQTKLADPVEDEFCQRVISEACNYAAKETGYSAETIAQIGFCGIKKQNIEPLEVIPPFEFFCDKKTKLFKPAKLASILKSQYEILTNIQTDQLYFYHDNLWNKNGDAYLRTIITDILGEESNPHRTQSTLYEIHSQTLGILPKSSFIALENCLLNPKTQEVKDFTSSEFVTVKLPLHYNPKAECPVNHTFWTEIVEKDQVPIIEEMLGYCLLQEMPIHTSFVLLGDGANGKSTLLNSFNVFLGSENVSHATLQQLCYGKFELAELYGKLANICDDLPSTALNAVGNFKNLTGNAPIQAQRKHKDPFDFLNTAKPFWACNKLPKASEDTVAYYRRFIILNFNHYFTGSKADKKLLEKLTTPEELSGLLNTALAALKRLLEKGEFSNAKSIEETRQQYIRTADSCQSFLEEMTEVTNNSNNYILDANLYSRYIAYCNYHDLPKHRKAELTISIQQNRPEAKHTQKKAGRAWEFLKLKEEGNSGNSGNGGFT